MSELLEINEENFGAEKIAEFDEWISTTPWGVSVRQDVQPKERIGTFSISLEFFQTHRHMTKLIWSEVDHVLDVEFVPVGGVPHWRCTAISPLFEPIEIGSHPPLYGCVLGKTEEGELEVTFKRQEVAS